MNTHRDRNFKIVSLATGLIGTLIVILGIFNYQIGICSDANIGCFEQLQSVGKNLFIAIPFLFFSIITAPMNSQVQKAWFVFSVPWVILTIIFSFFVPSGGGGWGGLHGAYEVLILFFLLAAYVVLSTCIILIKYILLARSKKA